MFAVVEMSSDGLFLQEVFDTREKAEDERDYLTSVWTHWNENPPRQQKKFEIFEVS